MPMVDVVQLVEHQVVILAVAGSSPVIHPDEWEVQISDLPLFVFAEKFRRLSISGLTVRHHGVGPLRSGGR